MSHDSITQQEAVQQLQQLLRVIERTNNTQHELDGLRRAPTTLALQAGAGIICGLFLLAELYNQALSISILYSVHDLRYRNAGIASMGILLIALVLGAYAVLFRSARNQGEAFSQYVARNFRSLQAFSFISDLFTKYVVLGVVIASRHPEFVAPLLALFTSDYLFQGRLFELPLRLSAGLGFCGLALAGYQLILGNSLLLPPLVFFCAVALGSAAKTVCLFRSTQNGTQYTRPAQ